MGYWGAWRCRSAKDWRISASPQSSTGAPAYCSGKDPYTPRMRPSSATRYPPGRASSCPGVGADRIVPLMIVSDMANLLLFPFRIFQTEKKRLPAGDGPFQQTLIEEPSAAP
jgi:hypothetical protein